VVRPLSFKRHRFPAEVIRQAVWLYFRFTLSIRDVEELLAQRGVEVSRVDPLLGHQVRSADRRQPAPRAVAADGPLASGRDGGEDRRPTDVSLARGR
jgi:hypothetical protein